jgi:integrase/recombinase XerD
MTQRGPRFPRSSPGPGDRATLRFLEYFTVNVRNKNTRVAYARAAADLLNWRGGQEGRAQPVHAAAYVELLQGKRSAPSIKISPVSGCRWTGS